MDKKKWRIGTYLIFGLVVFMSIASIITSLVVGRVGGAEILSIVMRIFSGFHTLLGLLLTAALIVNIVILSGTPENRNERRFVILALLTFLCTVVIKIGMTIVVKVLISLGRATISQIGILYAIGSILSALVFIVSAILFIVGGVISSKDQKIKE